MDIIITVPHSKCVSPSAQRNCDLRAKSVATQIYKKLKKLPSTNVSIHFADSVRKNGDLNRPVTRGWAWRRHIQKQIDNAIKQNRSVLVLDIHSFPNTTQSFGIDEMTMQVPNIVLLDYQNRYSNLQLPNTTVLKGSYLNDIMVQTLSVGGEALLLEFNEDKNYTTNKMITNFIDHLYNLITQNFSQQ